MSQKGNQCFLPLLYTSQNSTYLHDKLARVSSCHGGALSCSQDPNSPDVECSWSKVTSQYNTLGETREKDVFVNDLLRQRPKQNCSVASAVLGAIPQKPDSGPDLILGAFDLNFAGYSFIPLLKSFLRVPKAFILNLHLKYV